MFRPKKDEGIGFKNLIASKAMLAKACWRIIKRPYSLTSQILKIGYFDNTVKPLHSHNVRTKLILLL